MKKILYLALIMVFLTTSISFSQPNDDTMKFIKSLELINNNLSLVVKDILSGNYDEESIRKDLEYNNSLVKSIYNEAVFEYKEDKSIKNKTTLQKREEGTIFYIATLYSLAINGITLYLEDKSVNEMFLLDAICEYRQGTKALNVFKDISR
ncbi:MAG: hypothetical protein ACRCTZ_04555 [Sarcina sp.]